MHQLLDLPAPFVRKNCAPQALSEWINGMTQSSGPHKLAYFGAMLSSHDIIQSAIKNEFGCHAKDNLEILRRSEDLACKDESLVDLVEESVHCNAELAGSLAAWGDYGEFAINLMRFGNMYWIDASDFDNIGYFCTFESALEYAELNYEPFLTAYK
ncbi:hypothetical protein [Methylobacterium oxalidis]|uniref:hypothetical protein n=1 Tax=Methylobacterium oxalidis TaxID=944322 RepID=UPI0033154BCE